MKKIIVGLFILFLFCVSNYANVQILSQSGNMIEFSINFNQSDLNDFNKFYPNRQFYKNKEGIIPYLKYNFIITNLNSVSVEYKIVDSLFVDKENLPFADTLISQFPKATITISKPFIFRDFRGISLNFYPYRKVGETIIIFKKILVKIKTDIDIGENPLYNQHENIPLFFDIAYGYFFANYSYYKSENITPEKAIIIYDYQLEKTTQVLSNRLTENGIEDDCYAYPQDTGFGTVALKNFLKDIYDKNDDLTFLIFLSNNDMEFNDLSEYSQIVGNDKLPDIMVAKANENQIYQNLSNQFYSLFADYQFLSEPINFFKNQNKFNEQVGKIIFSDKYSFQNGYFLPLEKEELSSLIYVCKSVVDNNNSSFFSEVPFIYSVLMNKKFNCFIDPTILIEKPNNPFISTEIDEASQEPLILNIGVKVENKPIKNCLVAVCGNNKVLFSSYTNEEGRVQTEIEDKNDLSSVEIIFRHKTFGKVVRTFPLKELNTKTLNDTVSYNLRIFPNPYFAQKGKTSLSISYELKQDAYVSAIIYNIVGQTIKKLYSGFQKEGTHFIHWDGKDNSEKYVSNGIYYLMLKIGNKTEIKKISVIK